MAGLTPSALDALLPQNKEWEGAQKPVPLGVYPCFLTMTTQEKFGCREREDCTLAKPFVYVTKAFFLEDIQFRGAISDFHPMKKLIEKYPEDKLMLVWDEEEWYGQNFFLVHDLKVRDAVLADMVAREEAAAAKKAAGGGGGGGDGDGEGGGDGGPLAEMGEWKPTESKPWVSLGSEAELIEEATAGTRAPFVLALTRSRREFGQKHNIFQDRDAHDDPNLQYNDCRPYKDPNFELKRWTHDIAAQAIPASADTHAQTTWHRPANKALQYGAISLGERERLEALGSAGMAGFLTTVRERYEDALQQNESVDIFQDDFASLADEDTSLGNTNDSELRELQSFNHLTYCTDRMLCYLDWQPGVKGTIATANSQRARFGERLLDSGKVQTGFVLLWSFADPIHPQFVLEAPCDVFCFRFCPSHPNIIVGGLASGQVCMWDLAEARKAHSEENALTDSAESKEGGANTIHAQIKMLSAVDQGHKRTITDLVWLPPTLEAGDRNKFARKPKEAQPAQTQFLTIAGDGQLLVWDTRRAIEVLEQEKGPKGEPGEKTEKDKKMKEGWGAKLVMPLPHTDSGAELSVTSLILDVPKEENAICRLLAVTEDGEYITVNLLEPNTEGAKGTIAGGVRANSLGHYGPCTALERSPFVPDVYLSVGDWSFNLWKDGVSTPLFVAPFAGVGPNARLTCGAWSPTRPGVIFIGRSDGGIDVWDLLDRSHEPSTSFTVAGSAVLRLSFTEASGTLSKAGGQILAVGDEGGTAHILEVPRNLRRAASNEKAFTQNFFEREMKRVDYQAQRGVVRSEEAVEKEAAKAQAEVDEAAQATGDAEGLTGEDEKLEDEFKAMELAFKEEMGIVDEVEAPAEAAAAEA